jgi:6-pyruvoyltetrahydropterin/6-carboxytetrahydropterin synthase
MSWLITKDFHLSYSHQLTGLPDGHPCGRVHGHNAVVRVTLTAEGLDAHGFVLDYGDLKPLSTWLDETLDHRHLNEVLPYNVNPTAENLARLVYLWIEREHPDWPVASIGWSETPKTWAVYAR